MVDVTPYGDTALAHLNRAGDQGWELVAMSEDPSLPGNNELHRYHLKRPKPAAPPPRQRMRAGRPAREPCHLPRAARPRDGASRARPSPGGDSGGHDAARGSRRAAVRAERVYRAGCG